MTERVSHETEREAFADFARHHGEEQYRELLHAFYAAWQRFNEQYFAGRLKAPHLGVGRTGSRSLGLCAPSTDYGGELLITLNAGLAFGDNRKLVVRPLPAEGVKRFIDDLLLRLTVWQFVVEIEGVQGARCFGLPFAEHANRIGAMLGLRKVVTRSRKKDGRAAANGWPHCVRPEGYYCGDVTAEALQLVGVERQRGKGRLGGSCRGVLEVFDSLLQAGRVEDLRRIVTRQLKWDREVEEGGFPRRKEVEAGEQDVDGSALAEVKFRPEWLAWNGGCVERLARSICQAGSFAELPLLADAMEEAGCKNHCILGHLRAKMEHGRGCWVLRGLLAINAG